MSDTRSVLRLALPAPRRLLPGLLFGILSGASAVALMACSAWLITRAAEQPSLMFLSAAIVGVRAFALARAAFRYAERLASHDTALRRLGGVRVALLERILPLAPDGLGFSGRGDLLSRFSRDVDGLTDLPVRVVQPLVVAGVVGLGSVVAVAAIAPAAAAALLVCLVIAALAGTVLDGAVAARAQRTIAPLRGELDDRILDVLSRLDVLVAFDAVPAELDRVRVLDDRLRAAERRAALGAGVAASVGVLASGAASLIALLTGVPSVLDGGLDGPGLALIVLVPMAVFEVCAVVPVAAAAWRGVRVGAGRIADAVPSTVPVEIPRPTADAVPLSDSHDISLRDFGVRWPGAGGSAAHGVDGIDLDVAQGERVLIVGESGSGKTSIAHALVRFLEHSGSYRLGGVEAGLLQPDDVRRVVGLCEQTPWLFDADLRQNLLFAHDTATDAELLDALDRVGLADWAGSRGGLDAPVGERGALISGGQAQRIAVARAILAEFPVLVLDEPTANVDPDQADALLRDLLGATRGRSVILISHADVPLDLVDTVVRVGTVARVGESPSAAQIGRRP